MLIHLNILELSYLIIQNVMSILVYDHADVSFIRGVGDNFAD